jgi:hypothetical protein
MTSEVEGKVVRHHWLAGGQTGDVYIVLEEDDPSGELRKRVLKYRVTANEVKMATEWAARNHGKKENYSAGPVKKVYLKISHTEDGYHVFEHHTDASGKRFGLEMTNLGVETYENTKHKRTLGENILLYLMIVHCTLRLAGLKIVDTAWHNCMVQGEGENFKIFLVDTEKWREIPEESHIMQNFITMLSEFDLRFNKALDPIRQFLQISFTFERAFLDAMQSSCYNLSQHFLTNPEAQEESVHYHERIDSLLAAIEEETTQARVRLQAFEAREVAYCKAEDQLKRKGRLDTPFAADL